MRYRTLGRTGIKVSPYALGAMMFGLPPGNPDHDDSIRIIHKALDVGINFIDTADTYGDSEEVVGKALRGRRDGVVLATKVSRPMGDDPNQQGTSRRWIMTAVENSLRRLQTDHIDLYQIHRPDPTTDIEETLAALSDLIHSGKVRAIGSSTMPASDIVEAQWVAERRGLARFRTPADAGGVEAAEEFPLKIPNPVLSTPYKVAFPTLMKKGSESAFDAVFVMKIPNPRAWRPELFQVV